MSTDASTLPGGPLGSSRQYVQFVIPGIIVQTVVFATTVGRLSVDRL